MADRKALGEISANPQVREPAPEEWAKVEALLKLPPLASKSSSPTDGLVATSPSTLDTKDAAEPCTPSLSLAPRTQLSTAEQAMSGPTTGSKRSFDIFSTNDGEMVGSAGNEDETDDDGPQPTENCDQVRSKINRFIDNGGMRPGEFIKALDVNSKSYYTFMKYTGPFKGANSNIYRVAYRFFKERESRGVPMPKKQKTASSASPAALVVAPASKTLDIVLDGEMTDDVEVFDSCDEIRRKINAHLRKPGVTPTAFLRELEAQVHADRKPNAKLQGVQLTRFRAMQGSEAGHRHIIYYMAFVYFEKERIAEGKPKSKHRLAEENHWGKGGTCFKEGKPKSVPTS